MEREARGLYPERLGSVPLPSGSQLISQNKEHAVVFVVDTTIQQLLLDDERNQS